MAPHHHLRASFLTNPGLFSFPPAAAPVVASARTATAREPTSSRSSPRPLVHQRPLAHPRTTSALSTCATIDTTGSNVLHPIVQRIAEPIKANVTEPFWRGLKDGTIESRNRERTQSEAKGLKTSEKKRALVFAGLVGRVTACWNTAADASPQGSYPHQPSSPTDASLHLWERASEALVTPCPKIGYVPRTIDEEKGAMRGSLGDGMDPGLWRRWNKGWLRGWVGNRSIVSCGGLPRWNGG